MCKKKKFGDILILIAIFVIMIFLNICDPPRKKGRKVTIFQKKMFYETFNILKLVM